MKKLDYDFIIQNTIDNFAKGNISMSQIHGYGLFSNDEIKKNEILCILDGQVISWSKYYKVKENLENFIDRSYAKYLFKEWNALDENTLLVRALRTKYSFINHSRSPNLKLVKYPLRIIAVCDIANRSELTLDYRKENLNNEYLQRHGATYL